MTPQKPEVGSRWMGRDRDVFVVLSVTEQDGHTWVHYRNDTTGQEYSCWADSFTQRFNQYSNYQYPR